ncbi:hypothetical protein FKM82_017758 [Ascaphus truei]
MRNMPKVIREKDQTGHKTQMSPAEHVARLPGQAHTPLTLTHQMYIPYCKWRLCQPFQVRDGIYSQTMEHHRKEPKIVFSYLCFYLSKHMLHVKLYLEEQLDVKTMKIKNLQKKNRYVQ